MTTEVLSYRQAAQLERFGLEHLTCRPTVTDDDDEINQSLSAYFEGESIGQLEMSWTGTRARLGEITSVQVDPIFRRKGVATALLAEATRLHEIDRYFLNPRHSVNRTEDGEAWARSFGVRLPKWEREEAWD